MRQGGDHVEEGNISFSRQDPGVASNGDGQNGNGADPNREVRPELVSALLTRLPDRVGSLPGRRKVPRPKVSVVIPALNEERNLPIVLPRIGAWVDEVILVDGFSVDATTYVAQTLLPRIRIVPQEGRGKGAALRTGFAAATGDIIVMLDADGSTDPREIPLFVGALAAGADFVKGTRFVQGAGTEDMSLLRRCGNAALVRLVRLLFGGRFSDLCYGYIAFWKRTLPYLDVTSEGFAIETELNLRALIAGLKIVEVPSFEFERVHGKSNLRTFPDGWSVLKTIFRVRMMRPASGRGPRRVAELPQAEQSPAVL